MNFEEPKVEFVTLEKDMFTTQTSCTGSNACDQYGVETCLGAAPMNECDDEADYL